MPLASIEGGVPPLKQTTEMPLASIEGGVPPLKQTTEINLHLPPSLQFINHKINSLFLIN